MDLDPQIAKLVAEQVTQVDIHNFLSFRKFI